jgi:copper chaperone CopZ
LDFQDALINAGYSIPTAEIVLQVKGMTCISCVSHVQGALEDLPGVLNVRVHLNKGIAQVSSVTGMVTVVQMIHAVESAGYHAVAQKDGNLETPEPESSAVSKDDGLAWHFKNIIRKS